MTLLELIVYLVIACVCGAIARGVVGGSGGGFGISVLVGFFGALLGTWFARQLHLPTILVVNIGQHPFPIVWSIIGGIVMVGIAHALTRQRFGSRFLR